MAEITTTKAVCEKCGADVREGTTFCYNCGGQIASVAVVEEKAAMPVVVEPESAKPEVADVPKGQRISKAAEQRRKARVTQRRSYEYTWEPTNDSRLALLAAVLIAVLVLAIVFFTVYWK